MDFATFACELFTVSRVLSIALIFVLIILKYVLKKETPHPGRPLPGPTGLPILGCLPFLRPRLYVATTRYQKQYGNVFQVPLGLQKFVFINSYKSLKEALIKQGDCFSGRFQFELLLRSNRGKGILFTDGPLWHEHRRFALRVLKDFGLGRSSSEQMIVREAIELCDSIEKEIRLPLDTKLVFSRNVSNVISTLAFGERLGHDPKFEEFMRCIDDLAAAGFATLLPIIFPIINRHPWLFQPVEWYLQSYEKGEICHAFIREKIEEHRSKLFDTTEESLDGERPSAENYCDALLIEQHHLNSLGEEHSFSEWQLIRVLLELFAAGTDTTSVTLSWACVLLSFHPEIQEKVHEEIDDVFGCKRTPTMADRRSCHYINAVLDEISRISTITPFGLPHRTITDCVVDGAFIPKDSIIMPSIYSVHNDPELWDNPSEFRPERFINPDDGTYVSSEYLITFGLGKRACLGESLARMELFLFFIILLQRFTFRVQKPHPPLEEFLLGNDGAVRYLPDHRIIFDLRESWKST